MPVASVPDRIPVGVELPLVGDLPVGAAADRVDRNRTRCGDRGTCRATNPTLSSLADVAAVAAHLVGDHPIRLALPGAKRDVDVALIERDPELGLLVAGLPPSGSICMKSEMGLASAVQRLVEPPVNAQWLGQTNRTNGDLAGAESRLTTSPAGHRPARAGTTPAIAHTQTPMISNLQLHLRKDYGRNRRITDEQSSVTSSLPNSAPSSARPRRT